jgi:hypothetical protein
MDEQIKVQGAAGDNGVEGECGIVEKKCGTCAIYDKEHGICVRTQTGETEDHYCNHWVSELSICNICGRPYYDKAILVYEEGTWLHCCENCGTNLGRCATCVNRDLCAFQQDTSCPYPPMVQRTMRQGNMVISQTVPNPERIKATCLEKCKCGSSEYGCQKQLGFCPNYEMRRAKGVNV